jgi:phosphate transport system substrate-binding protein
MKTRPFSKRTVAATCLAMVLAVSLATSGCGNRKPSGFKGNVKVSGSTTVLPISQEAASEFSDENPAARVDVQGGGSSVGITQLIQGVVQIGNSSRELNPDEAKGLVDHKIAFDMIAIVVNPKMPVSNLSDAQVKAIFTGRTTNWKQVGGPDQEIVAVVRDQASGTREVFDKKALGATNETPVESVASAIESSSNGVVREIVATTDNAIGYISFGYVNKRLKAVAFNDVMPTVPDAVTGKYPMARYLHMFTKGEPEGAVKGYIDFVLSKKFQDAVVAREYIKISDVRVK